MLPRPLAQSEFEYSLELALEEGVSLIPFLFCSTLWILAGQKQELARLKF